jgi:hypothetical protein
MEVGPMEVRMHKGVLVAIGVSATLTLVAVSATDASACSRRARVCSGYAPAPVYQYAPPPVYYAPSVAYFGPPPPLAPYEAPPAYGYVSAGSYGYRGCDRGYGYGNGYGNGYGYGYAPPAAYDSYRPAAVWAPFR